MPYRKLPARRLITPYNNLSALRQLPAAFLNRYFPDNDYCDAAQKNVIPV
jgi:hypothetical protein